MGWKGRALSGVCAGFALITTMACSDHEAGGGETRGDPEPVAEVQLASSHCEEACDPDTCEQPSIVVDGDGATGFTRVEDAFAWLARRKLENDFEVQVRAGVYKPFYGEVPSALYPGQSFHQTSSLVIDHPEAAHVTLRGEPRFDVPLSGFGKAVPTCAEPPCEQDEARSHYRVAYDVAANIWSQLYTRLAALPAWPEEAPEAYALIRRTRQRADGTGLNHAVHQGVWRVDVDATMSTPGKLVVLLKYRPQALDSALEPEGLAPLPAPLDAKFDTSVPPVASILTTVLKFTCSQGVVIDGSRLKRMEDIVVVGDYDAAGQPSQCALEQKRREANNRHWSENFPGITAHRGGGVELHYVGVTGMDGSGISVRPNSWAVATRVAASSNERRGFYTTFTGAASFNETIASANRTDGYITDHSAFAELESAWAVGNTENGYNAIFSSRNSVANSTATLNGVSGFSARGATMWFDTAFTSSDAFRNTEFGVFSEIGGRVRLGSLKLEGNGGGVGLDLGVKYWWDAPEEPVDPEAPKPFDNRDALRNDLNCAAAGPDLLEPQPRTFFSHKELATFPVRACTPFEKTKVVIDPTLSETPDTQDCVARSLHDFFNVAGACSIAEKRIRFPDLPPVKPTENYLTVKLGAGVYPHQGKPIVIAHPDAKRVKIEGERCELKVSAQAPTAGWPACDPTVPNCREVEFDVSDADGCPVKEGDFLAIQFSENPNCSDDPKCGNPACEDVDCEPTEPSYHWMHRGVFQVADVDLNNGQGSLKVWNFGGAGLTGADLGVVRASVLRSILYFPAITAPTSVTTGGLVVDGTTLGLLKDVVLVGANLPLSAPNLWPDLAARTVLITSTPALDRTSCSNLGYAPEAAINEKSGLKIQNCAHAYFYRVAVAGFPHAGIRVAGNSSLIPWPFTDGFNAASLVASANGTDGIVAIKDGTIWAKRSVTNANGASGYYAASGAAIAVAHSSSAANAEHGFEILDGAHVEAGTIASIRNAQDGARVNAARFTAPSDNAEGITLFAQNGGYGVKLQSNSYAALNDAWAIGRGSQISNSAGIHLGTDSVCRCYGLTLKHNDYPIKAMTGSLVHADGSQCDQHWFIDAASGARIVGEASSCGAQDTDTCEAE